MKFSWLIPVLLFSTFLLTTEAHHVPFGPVSNANSLSPSPSPIHFHSPRVACRTLFFPEYNNPFVITKITNPAVNRACSITENPTKCIALISPCITGSTNSFSALEAAIISLFEHVEHALSFALKLSKSKSTSPEITTALYLCIEFYVKVIDHLKKALAAFKAHDTDAIKTVLTAAITNFGRCDEAFHQQGLIKNWPLKKIDHVLIQLSEFGLDIHAKIQ